MEFAQLATPAALGVDRVVIRHGHGYGEEIGKAGKGSKAERAASHQSAQERETAESGREGELATSYEVTESRTTMQEDANHSHGARETTWAAFGA
jgi:hypothetical protein